MSETVTTVVESLAPTKEAFQHIPDTDRCHRFEDDKVGDQTESKTTKVSGVSSSSSRRVESIGINDKVAYSNE